MVECSVPPFTVTVVPSCAALAPLPLTAYQPASILPPFIVTAAFPFTPTPYWPLVSGVALAAEISPLFMLVNLLGKSDAAKAGTWTTPFTDVPAWAAPYVGYAYENGLTAGLSKTLFGSSSPITGQQYLTLVLSALGYDEGADFSWQNASALADKLGLAGGDSSAAAEFLRGDLAIISASALTQNFKGTDVDLTQVIALGKSLAAESDADIPAAEIAAIAQTVAGSNGKLSGEDITAIAKLVAAEYDAGLPVDQIASITVRLVDSKGTDVPVDEIASVVKSVTTQYKVNLPVDGAVSIYTLISGLINK